MKNKTILVCIFFFILNYICFAQSPTILKEFPTDFKDNVFTHIEHLASFGIRSAESESETKTIHYLKTQFEISGLTVEIEPFHFSCFVLENVKLQLGQNELEPDLLVFNPYNGTQKLEGRILFFDPDSSYENYNKQKIEDRIIITRKPANYFRLAFKNPKAILFLKKNDFSEFKDQNELKLNLLVQGEIKQFKSFNVIATLSPDTETTHEILISAHWDSYLGPGADDNGSGLGVILELANYFSNFKEELPCRLKFVAFGAEELGLLGSQAYIKNHSQDLKNCELLFNIDQVGGRKGIYVEMRGGIKNISQEKGTIQLPEQLILKSTSDFNGKWSLFHPDMMISFSASNVPDWLKKTITTCGEELGYNIIASNQMGSDHLLFALAGIVATNIAISGGKSHCPEDTPDQINIDSLEKAGKIVAAVVMKTMDRY